MPVSAPIKIGKPKVTWGIVPVTFQTKRVLYTLIPVFAYQSKFLIVTSLPPSVRFPQRAKNEQWILFLLRNFLRNFTASNKLDSITFNKI